MPEADEDEQFIAEKTGIPLARVSRIHDALRRVGPSSESQRLTQQIKQDAEAAGVSREASWDAYRNLAELDVEGLPPMEEWPDLPHEELNRHVFAKAVVDYCRNAATETHEDIRDVIVVFQLLVGD